MRPVMRRGDAGEGQLELGRLDLGLGHLHRRLRVAHDRHAVVEGLLRDDLPLHQRLAAHDVEVGVLHLGLGRKQLGLRLLQRALERPRIDHEQQVALLDGLAVLEVHLGEIAGDARAHLDGLDRVEAAGVLVPLDDLALQRLGDRDDGGAVARPSAAGRRARAALVASRDGADRAIAAASAPPDDRHPASEHALTPVTARNDLRAVNNEVRRRKPSTPRRAHAAAGYWPAAPARAQ